MAEEYKPESASHGAEAVETEGHGLSRYGDKKDQEVLAADFDEKPRDEKAGEGGEKETLKEKLDKKDEDTSMPVEITPPVSEAPHPEEKKGLLEKIKDKLAGGSKKPEEGEVAVVEPPTSPAVETPAKEKKGLLEKIEDKPPGGSKKPEEAEMTVVAPPTSAVETPGEEKKVLLEEIQDQIHEFHFKTEEEKEREKD